jgi:hypothetical protein
MSAAIAGSSVLFPQEKMPNKITSLDAAIARGFHAVRPWRGASEFQCSHEATV